MKPTISVIGTGRMGSALARALLNQGYSVTLWNRTPAKALPLAALGAQIAPTLSDAVTAADLVIVNVNDYATSDHLLQTAEVANALRGKVLIQLTSGTPQEARTLGAWAGQHAIPYLAGAIIAPPNLIGDPGCTLVFAGSGELFEQTLPLLRTLGGNAVYLGEDVGHASALDNALLAFLWGTMFGVLQGAAVCEAEQFPFAAYASSLQAILPAVAGSATEIVERIEHSQFAGETSQGTVELHSGGVYRLRQLCRQQGIQDAVPTAFVQILQAALQAGHGQDDFAVLHKFMR